MIRLDAITKTFPGVTALDAVSFDVRPGEVHALCGENGAGKSTLMNVLSGVWRHGTYGGRILRAAEDGGDAGAEELRFHGVRDAAAAGIAIVHQELALMPEMSVLDNLFLGREPHRRGHLRRDVERRVARAHFDRLGFQPPLDVRAGELSIGLQQRIEIARALLAEPDVLVLDEPTSALPEEDARALLAWIRRLADGGTACVYITHRMEEVFAIADRITVLRDGRAVWTRPAQALDPATVIAAMVDRPPTDLYAHTPLPPGEPLLRLEDARVERGGRTVLRVEELVVRRGEIVGLAGMMGAGRTCLLRALAGALRRSRASGRLRDPAGGTSPLPSHPREALRRGYFLIPEDRKREALFLDENLVFNTTCATVARYRRGGRMNEPAMREATARHLGQFDVRAAGPGAIARTLSGGNQQKVLLCRAAEVQPKLLLLDEPTRGIDVGAKAAIYRQMEAWTRAGWGILWSSSELQELLGISDRVYVLANGRVTATFTARPFEEHAVMARAAAG